LGEIDTAVARLLPLAASSEDPDYAAQLARILREAGRNDESLRWGQFAAVRYDELVARHPEAFADHAAEFWLTTGADPGKALRLPRVNFELAKRPAPTICFPEPSRESCASIAKPKIDLSEGNEAGKQRRASDMPKAGRDGPFERRRR
jgi:hypothetical protein